MLSATVTRAGEDAAVQSLFGLIKEDARPPWQRAALLRGAEVALLGAAMPGTSARRGGPAIPNAPCPTCPGGRAGPGGAYAFRDPAAAPAPPTGRGAGGRTLKLAAAPAALSELAAGSGDLAKRAAAVLARVEWPGKPGTVAVTPLTADEQKRFDAGREVYRNICQACHQPDGRGMEKIAPSLVGSQFALAPPEIPIRILMNGKEGQIGLMPPVGQIFTDEQIAAVLTYVRREWGQTGSPVDPATVAAVRASTADRTRPWTNAELSALMPKGR
jgi:mono/diheme cytochrome c family protein